MIRPSLRLRASMVLGLAVLTVALAACSGSRKPAASPAPTSPVSASTASKTFHPYDSTGAIIAPVGSHASGTCWTNSIADPSASTYRCIAGNQILDPCFAPPGQANPKTVACFADPWSAGTLLTLTSKLPASDPTTRNTPWAIQLANGAKCTALTGTVDQVGSLDLSYGCGGGAEAGLDGSAGVGTALTVEYRPSDSAPLQSKPVSAAWH